MTPSDEERRAALAAARLKAETIFDPPPSTGECSRPEDSHPEEMRPKEKGIKSPLLALGCAAFISIPFLLVGLTVLWIFTVGPMFQWMGARSWPAAECTIVTSGFHMKFAYSYEDVEHRSEMYDFASFYAFTDEADIARYPAGQPATCFVNPSDPTEAILSKRFSSSYLDGLWGLPFLIAGLVMAFAFGMPAVKQLLGRRSSSN